jgi:hypothetical protein
MGSMQEKDNAVCQCSNAFNGHSAIGGYVRPIFKAEAKAPVTELLSEVTNHAGLDKTAYSNFSNK